LVVPATLATVLGRVLAIFPLAGFTEAIPWDCTGTTILLTTATAFIQPGLAQEIAAAFPTVLLAGRAVLTPCALAITTDRTCTAVLNASIATLPLPGGTKAVAAGGFVALCSAIFLALGAGLPQIDRTNSIAANGRALGQAVRNAVTHRARTDRTTDPKKGVRVGRAALVIAGTTILLAVGTGFQRRGRAIAETIPAQIATGGLTRTIRTVHASLFAGSAGCDARLGGALRTDACLVDQPVAVIVDSIRNFLRRLGRVAREEKPVDAGLNADTASRLASYVRIFIDLTIAVIVLAITHLRLRRWRVARTINPSLA
jgi:hypothetical protein